MCVCAYIAERQDKEEMHVERACKIIECAIDIDNTVPSRTRHAPSISTTLIPLPSSRTTPYTTPHLQDPVNQST